MERRESREIGKRREKEREKRERRREREEREEKRLPFSTRSKISLSFHPPEMMLF